MRVEIWSDIACPWCYVGKRRFEAALAAFAHRDDIDVTWRSFELDPSSPARHAEPHATLLSAKYGMPVARAQEMLESMTATGAAEGITFRFDRGIVGNTFDAHRLLHFAAAHGARPALVERLFTAYFTDGEVVSDREVLVRIAGEAGLDADAVRAMLASDAHAADVRSDEARARQYGITGVPFFAIDGKYGVSGAQSADVLASALQEAWDSRET